MTSVWAFALLYLAGAVIVALILLLGAIDIDGPRKRDEEDTGA